MDNGDLKQTEFYDGEDLADFVMVVLETETERKDFLMRLIRMSNLE